MTLPFDYGDPDVDDVKNDPVPEDLVEDDPAKDHEPVIVEDDDCECSDEVLK